VIRRGKKKRKIDFIFSGQSQLGVIFPLGDEHTPI
jgi:hypothetical protein